MLSTVTQFIVNPDRLNILYDFSADKGEWVSSIKCGRKSFGLAVINGDLTLVGGESLHSTLKNLTSFVRNKSGAKWIQKYPPMSNARVGVQCCSNEHLLVVGSRLNFKVPWKSWMLRKRYGRT